jgi:hypothetical protein
LAATTKKQDQIQKSLRCPSELNVQINRAKGTLMVKTGERVSDNQFIINLLEMGLDMLKEKINMNFSSKG